MKLDRYDIALTNACAKEDSRPVLTCVCLRDGILAAADGFILVIRETDTKGKEQANIPAAILKQITLKEKETAEMEVKADSIVVSNFKDARENLKESSPTMTFKLPESGEYPKWQNLFDSTPSEKKAQTTVSIGLLRQLLSCLPESGIIRIGVGETSQAIEFECRTYEHDGERPIYALLMPMWTDWHGFKWHREPQPVKPTEKEAEKKEG